MSECTLTPSARAFSSMLSAFIGSVVNGLTSGWLIAFITGWITWFAFFRVFISGLYMLYRSVTGSWTPELGTDEYEMLNRAPSPDPESLPPPYFNNEDHSQASENNYLSPNPAAISPPKLSELSVRADEPYHLHVYTTLYGPDGSLAPRLHKESAFGTFWPTRADIAARNHNAKIAQEKRKELRKFYASDRDFQRALTAFTLMRKQRRLPGPAPHLAYWEAPNRTVTVLGWLGWLYSAVYSPITQIIWIAASVSSGNDSGLAKIVKGISVAVTALPLCIDTKVRFAESLRTKRFGGTWAYYAFNITNATSCLLQGIFCATLLIWGVIDMQKPKSDNDDFPSTGFFPWPLVGIYPIFSIIWAWGSFKFVPMMDGGRKRAADKHWTGYFFDVGMGAFAGLFVAAPAFALYMSSVNPGEENTGSSDLGEYLRCEVPLWLKFSAVFP